VETNANGTPSGGTLESIRWLLDAARYEEQRMQRRAAEVANAIKVAASSESDNAPGLNDDLAGWQKAKQRAQLLREIADHEAQAMLRARTAGPAEELLTDWERIQAAEAKIARLEQQILAAQEEGNTGWIHREGAPRLKDARQHAEALRAALTTKLL
jgi:hypothetical protein